MLRVLGADHVVLYMPTGLLMAKRCHNNAHGDPAEFRRFADACDRAERASHPDWWLAGYLHPPLGGRLILPPSGRDILAMPDGCEFHANKRRDHSVAVPHLNLFSIEGCASEADCGVIVRALYIRGGDNPVVSGKFINAIIFQAPAPPMG